MSHIFDALQRSEGERGGNAPTSFSIATELLQAAEEKMRRQDASGDSRSTPCEPNPSLPANWLDQCPSLPVFVPSDNRLVSVGREESLGAEKFRYLTVRLRQLRQSRPLKKLLITSTIPQEGKSTVAANLACALASRKAQKTLLLEGDLRRPTVARQFGLGNVPGLSEWFRGETGAMNVYRLESLGLWVLPAGNAPGNALESLQSGKLSPLMEQMTACFDWIVIDSPPVLPLGDTSIWARLADAILLVTRPGVTEKKQLQRGLEIFEKSKLLGALVNASTDAAHSNYYQRYAPPPTAAQSHDANSK
jgi:protein-tyrosine kinase